MKKREFAELEKTSSFKLNQGLLTPVKAPRPKEEELGSQELNQGLTPVKAFRKKAFDAFEVVQSLFSELRIGQGSNASKNSKVDGDSHPSTSDMKGLLQVLVARRSLEFLGLPKEDMDRLREAYVLVEDHINEESLGIISDHMKPCDPSNDYYEFKLTNVHCSRPEDYIFDTTLTQICLKKKIHLCCTNIVGSREKAVRIWNLLLELRHLLKNNKSITLREVYYKFPHVYSNQNKSNDDVQEVSAMTGITLQSLNVLTSSTGIIKGPLLFYIGEELLADCTLGGISGFKIPVESHNISAIRTTRRIDFIVVVEKEDTFELLAKDQFDLRNHCVLFSGRGQPSATSRLLLRKLRDALGVPIYGLFDGNYGGASIYCTYRFGSANRSHDSLLLTVPDLIWIGVFPDEVRKEYRKKWEGKP